MRANLTHLAERLRGSPIVRDLAAFRQRLQQIDRLRTEMRAASDDELASRSAALRAQVLSGAAPEALEVQAFALVREAAWRELGLEPFDEQLLGALAMSRGYVVEMQTGEGKTLAAVFTAYTHALAGQGVHVMTHNDYLARRDAAWMAALYVRLGLQVDAVQHEMGPDRRRRAYAADVTYLTAKEAGFDLLRGDQGVEPGALVQRAFHFALVDEADSLLIDEARVPLVIAGRVDSGDDTADAMAQLVRRLRPMVDYETDEYRRNVNLTDEGLSQAQSLLGSGDLLAHEQLPLLTGLNCALHAEVLLRRDVDYLVSLGKIEVIDELTGRVVKDRQWPDGLQAALQAKEGLEGGAGGRILGTITVQHLLELYPGLCGMTGTAQSAADELFRTYGLAVAIIPPHRPCVRRDEPDRVFTHLEAKLDALVTEIETVHQSGRPILVGTLSVAESEDLSRRLVSLGVACRTLNARNDEDEARVIAGAGDRGAVTISTNMAGRGTDILLGGARAERRDEVLASGGLYVIGTNRHESLRIDRQLRGRAGRQGDPGSSCFFVSLEDPLIVRYGIEQLIPRRHWPPEQAQPLGQPLVRREIARAQRIIDGQNFEIRCTLCEYSRRVEEQRRILIDDRQAVLFDRAPLDALARAEPPRYADLCRAVGADAVRQAERSVTLFHLDRCWSEHLDRLAELREGIHLLRIGRQDPLSEYARAAAVSFQEALQLADERVLQSLRKATITEQGIDLEYEGLLTPSATWTYLVNDDPFRDQLALQLGANTGAAAGAALYAGPFLALWGLARWWKRRRRRRP